MIETLGLDSLRQTESPVLAPLCIDALTDLSSLVDDEAVWAPIHRLAGALDKALPGIFAADYSERLEAAAGR